VRVKVIDLSLGGRLASRVGGIVGSTFRGKCPRRADDHRMANPRLVFRRELETVGDLVAHRARVRVPPEDQGSDGPPDSGSVGGPQELYSITDRQALHGDTIKDIE
jgi:hypothetical protein